MKQLWGIAIAGLSVAFLSSCKVDKNGGPQIKESGITGSEWFMPVGKTSLWEELGTVNGGKYFRTQMTAEDITSETIENSVILLYAKLSGYDAGIWEEGHVGLLPTKIITSIAANNTDEWTMAVSPGQISIRLQNSDYFYPSGGPNAGHQFRYIIIPKASSRVTGQKSGSTNPLSRYSESELRDLSYDDICRQAGIKK